MRVPGFYERHYEWLVMLFSGVRVRPVLAGDGFTVVNEA